MKEIDVYEFQKTQTIYRYILADMYKHVNEILSNDKREECVQRFANLMYTINIIENMRNNIHNSYCNGYDELEIIGNVISFKDTFHSFIETYFPEYLNINLLNLNGWLRSEVEKDLKHIGIYLYTDNTNDDDN